MANDNNNINELVADDDPTAELELPTFPGGPDNLDEADARTYDSEDAEQSTPRLGVTVSELRTDLQSRQKTIGQLQYDIEQLRTKWLGLEAEIQAREEQTTKLNSELQSSSETIARKERLIKKRDLKIKSLKSEIREREKDYRDQAEELDQLRAAETALSDALQEESQRETEREAQRDVIESPVRPSSDNELRQKLQRSEIYADTLRQQSQDLMETNSFLKNESEALDRQLKAANESNAAISTALQQATTNMEELQAQLDNVQEQHDQEIRTLRFELGAAQDTVVESEQVNSRLASDLVDAQGFKTGLEEELERTEARTHSRVEKLQKQINNLTRKVQAYEQKLTTKSEAITVLLAELAKKSDQIESIGEIEEVIHDIDERMSERTMKQAGERVTRVLVGTVDDQVLRFPLFKDRLTIGRTTDNDIQLKAAYVSRRHAVIQTDGDRTRIIDWGSKNGIHVNSKRVSEHFLNPSDVITIGNARFRYEERKKRDN